MAEARMIEMTASKSLVTRLDERLTESTAILMALRHKLNNIVQPKIIADITAVIDKNDEVGHDAADFLSAAGDEDRRA